MDQPAGNEDAWVVMRISALERGNRRLWLALGALGMILVSTCLAAALLLASVREPSATIAGGPKRGDVVADNVTVHGALRIVDAGGRSLVWIGPEPAKPGATAPAQTVIGLFAGSTPETQQQTVRLATSALGSALALSTPDGQRSASLFAGEAGGSLELRRGETLRVISQRSDGGPVSRALSAEAVQTRAGNRAETPTAAVPAAGEAGRGASIDLSDPALYPLGNGFYVGRLSLSDERGELRVSGRIVNASSVDQLRAEFRLVVADREVPFTVARIAAGGSTSFGVEIPNADAAALRSARMRWVRSTVSYDSE